MCRDLPAFDSVWLDALVQIGRLTHYQARLCGSRGPGELAVGPYVVVDRLPGDARWTQFLARRPGDAARVQLTVLTPPDCDRDAVFDRLQRLTTDLAGACPPQIAAPRAVQALDRRLVVVSPHVAGRSLSELLVRRGRFPISAATEVMRHMAVSLESLERTGVLHGDLRLRHVVVDERGVVRLTQPGLLAALEPWVTIHSQLPPDGCDGVAPELIESRSPRTRASDMYACGCLWWQLMTGRPPFPVGDPLAKLAAHQSRRVGDLREWAPDAPATLALLLERMTHPLPQERPQGMAEVLHVLGRPTTPRSARLRRFVRAFQSAAPRSLLPDETPSRFGRLLLATGSAAMLLAAFGWMQVSGRIDVTRFARAAGIAAGELNGAHASIRTGPAAKITSTAESPPESARQLLPLPEPRQGVVTLAPAGRYAATAIAAAGPLTISAAAGERAVIVVERSPLQLTATKVVLQNVTIAGALQDGRPLLAVRAQEFGLVGCHVAGSVATAPAPGPAPAPAALVEWSQPGAGAALSGRMGCLDTLITGDSDAIHCHFVPASVNLQNVAYAGAGRMIVLAPGESSRPFQAIARRTTLCGASAFVSMAADPALRPPALLATLDHCLLGLGPGVAAGAGLVEFTGPATPAELQEALLACRIGGVESLLPMGALLATHRPTGDGQRGLDAAEMPVEGLRFAEIRFTPPAAGRSWSLEVQSVDGRAVPQPPIGCDPASFADVGSFADAETFADPGSFADAAQPPYNSPRQSAVERTADADAAAARR